MGKAKVMFQDKFTEMINNSDIDKIEIRNTIYDNILASFLKLILIAYQNKLENLSISSNEEKFGYVIDDLRYLKAN